MSKEKKQTAPIECRFSKVSKQRYPGDRTWKDSDVPSGDNNPKEQQDPLPNKSGK